MIYLDYNKLGKKLTLHFVVCGRGGRPDFDLASVPASVCRVFDDQFVTGNEAKRVFVSLGIFSIIKIERHVQLLIPSYDFCIPQKECVGATAPTPNRPSFFVVKSLFPL